VSFCKEAETLSWNSKFVADQNVHVQCYCHFNILQCYCHINILHVHVQFINLTFSSHSDGTTGGLRKRM